LVRPEAHAGVVPTEKEGCRRIVQGSRDAADPVTVRITVTITAIMAGSDLFTIRSSIGVAPRREGGKSDIFSAKFLKCSLKYLADIYITHESIGSLVCQDIRIHDGI
jgi:hypothetical protein